MDYDIDKVVCSKCSADDVISYATAGDAICPACCPDHEYEYDWSDRTRYCAHCGSEPPDDWYYSEDDIGIGSLAPAWRPGGPIGVPASSMNGNANAAITDPERWANWVAFCERNGMP